MNILITGGASGLGESITHKLASNTEDQVYFTYCSSEQRALKLEEQYDNCKAVKCDFTNPDDMEILLGFIENNDLDVLINNAFAMGISKTHFHKTQRAVFLDDFTINILPVIRITQKAILQFRKKKFGKIITILSSAIINKPPVGWSAYTAGKAYLASLNKTWATENIAFNITSNAISPAFMQTALTADTDERIVSEMEQSHPLKSLLNTREVAEAVNYLCQCSQQVNGINLPMNAGTDLLG